jgi:ribose transport system permease protein
MRFKNSGIFVVLLAIIVIATLINGRFSHPDNVRSLIRDTSFYGLMSIGAAFVIITGGIDLSIGSLVALSGILFVTVSDIHTVEVTYQAPITTIRNEVEAPFTKPAIRLDKPPPLVRGGDALVAGGEDDPKRWEVWGTQRWQGAFWVELVEPLPEDWQGKEVAFLRGETLLTQSQTAHANPWVSCAIVLLFASGIGLLHGVLIAWGRLQPFVVTLCGLLIYRGVARILAGDRSVGLKRAMVDFRDLVTGTAFEFPVPLIGKLSEQEDSWTAISWIDFPVVGILLIVVTVIAWVFLYRSVYGRHLLALGQNEQAALFSGVATKRLTLLAYMVSSFLAGLAGILFMFDWTVMSPVKSGAFYELYAIAAAVLGGCSLRGGQAALLGVIAGAAVIRFLFRAIEILGIGQQWEYVIIGLALFNGILFDEILRRVQARRRLKSPG